MEPTSYLTVASLLLIAYLLYKFMEKKQSYWTKYGVPRLNAGSMVSMLSKVWKGASVVQLEKYIYEEIGDRPFGGLMEAGTRPIIFIKDMELIRKVYVKDFEHFVNRRSLVIMNDINFKNMLVNKEDQEWKDLRSTMTPTFTTGKIRRMFPIFNDSSNKLVTYVKEEISKDKSHSGIVDMEDILGRYAMDVISSAAFGIESGIFKDPDVLIAKMAKKIPFKVNLMMMLKFFASMIFPFSAKYINLRFVDKEADEYFSKLLRDTIKYRERTGEKRNDFLQLMIETKNGQLQTDSKEAEQMDTYEKDAQLSSNKKTKAQITDDTIIAQCILFILGGFDTVSSGLIFSAYAMALNPEIQMKLRQELLETAQKGDGQLSYEDINQHEFLDKIINETLRMYPPATRTERRCTKDYPLNDTGKAIIPKDCNVGILVYQIHHDANNFPNPEVFDPERFSVEEKAKRSPYTFMPFGHGPRNCIANRFALTELKAALANLVMNFEIEPCAKSPIPLEFSNGTTLKPKGGMWLKLKSVK